jgi:tRNA A-37 threonylcarbamoyl transferase component Bud32
MEDLGSKFSEIRMAIGDWIEDEGGTRRGGQGIVERVRNIHDNRVGALKRLHQEAAIQRERRFRMMAEVAALRVLAGNGVPHVLDANEANWLNSAEDLYLIMEFVEGPTLTEAVQRSAPNLDQALTCTKRILDILAVGHAVPLHHRDLKPDNVIVRRGDWANPVLVDLGIAWHGSVERELETPAGQEMGNRFLRLPEFAPGGDHHDARSDLAMAAGLLFYMISGQAPRLPIDQHGRHPHQAEPNPIRPEILDDPRWPALARVLAIAFQPNPTARHRDAAEMRLQLEALDRDVEVLADDLDVEIARLRDLTNTAEAQAIARAGPAMVAANAELYRELERLWSQASLMHGGQGPTFYDAGATNRFYCVLSRLDLPFPNIVFRHILMVKDGRFFANWNIDGGPAGDGYYDGSSADGDGLIAACMANARIMAGIAVRAFNQQLSG